MSELSKQVYELLQLELSLLQRSFMKCIICFESQDEEEENNKHEKTDERLVH